jgi:AraC-like DNA-binding protein
MATGVLMKQSTHSAVIWPTRDLAGCVFCILVRDTRGSDLPHEDRFNYFPASPMACINWQLDGQCHLIESEEHWREPWQGRLLPRIGFSCPQLGALASWNPGPVRVVTMCLYPEAVTLLTGLTLASFTNAGCDVTDCLPDPLLAAAHTFASSCETTYLEPALERMQQEFASLWAHASSNKSDHEQRLGLWKDGLVAQATRTIQGTSTRQIARRVKALSGVTQRDLNNLARAETLYGTMHHARTLDGMSWAAIADQAGYADQAHMIRRTRQHTGLTPEELRTRIPVEEAFWVYRLLGQYFDRPEVVGNL